MDAVVKFALPGIGAEFDKVICQFGRLDAVQAEFPDAW